MKLNMLLRNQAIEFIRTYFLDGKRKIRLDLSSVDQNPGNIPSAPIFIVGTGRNGTHFFAKMMESDPSVFAVHLDTLDHPEADSFIPYVIWNSLPVDLMPFKEYRRKLIQYAANRNQIYFESNPYLSLVSDKLFEWFKARLILLIRNPEDVVNSHYVKGWYREIPPRSDPSSAPGFWPELTVNRFFGRLMPNGDEFAQWNNLTQIGKIAWWWKTLNVETLNRLEKLPRDHFRMIKLESFDYQAYRDLCQFLGRDVHLTSKKFEMLRGHPPGKGSRKKSAASWTAQERYEFEQQTCHFAKRIGY